MKRAPIYFLLRNLRASISLNCKNKSQYLLKTNTEWQYLYIWGVCESRGFQESDHSKTENKNLRGAKKTYFANDLIHKRLLGLQTIKEGAGIVFF